MRDPRDLDRLIARWGHRGRPPSEHAALEAAYAVRVGHRPGGPPPLTDGQPVPGCVCDRCTGIPSRAAPPRRRRLPRPRHDLRPALDVDAARAVPLLDVAEGLGLGEPERRGREFAVRCPLHEDARPSLRLNPDKGAWYCDPCDEGGSVIDLVMAARGVGFVEAVRYLNGR